MKQPNILADELRKLGIGDDAVAVLIKLIDEMARSREDVATWRDAFETEHQDHEATIKAWNEERSGQ